jgi:hypothetical protein
MTTWTSLDRAAQALGMSAPALRKALDRRAARVADGGIEAELHGVRGRKLGRLWRVTFSAAWGGFHELALVGEQGHTSTRRVPPRIDRERTRS